MAQAINPHAPTPAVSSAGKRFLNRVKLFRERNFGKKALNKATKSTKRAVKSLFSKLRRVLYRIGELFYDRAHVTGNVESVRDENMNYGGQYSTTAFADVLEQKRKDGIERIRQSNEQAARGLLNEKLENVFGEELNKAKIEAHKKIREENGLSPYETDEYFANNYHLKLRPSYEEADKELEEQSKLKLEQVKEEAYDELNQYEKTAPTAKQLNAIEVNLAEAGVIARSEILQQFSKERNPEKSKKELNQLKEDAEAKLEAELQKQEKERIDKILNKNKDNMLKSHISNVVEESIAAANEMFDEDDEEVIQTASVSKEKENKALPVIPEDKTIVSNVSARAPQKQQGKRIEMLEIKPSAYDIPRLSQPLAFSYNRNQMADMLNTIKPADPETLKRAHAIMDDQLRKAKQNTLREANNKTTSSRRG